MHLDVACCLSTALNSHENFGKPNVVNRNWQFEARAYVFWIQVFVYWIWSSKAASCFYLSFFSCVKPIKTFWKPIRRSLAKIWTNYLLITFCRLRDKQFFLTYPAVYSQAVEIRWYYHPLEWIINNPCKRYCFWGENLYPLLRRYDTFKTVIE